MKKLFFTILSMLAMAGMAQDRLYIEDFDMTAGKSKSIEVLLDNDSIVYSALQFDLEMPQGLQVRHTEKNGYIVSATVRAFEHDMSCQMMPNGQLRIWLTSQESQNIEETEGAVLTMSVIAADGFSGEHELWLRNIVLAETMADGAVKRHTLPDYKCRVNPSSVVPVKGDVDGDGKVDVSDVNAVINIILKTKTAADYTGVADVDGDGKIDVSDVNEIINIILKTN
ncbi:MAG: dockerin type I repeat-containing protein [Muribaculaceae bacterium]|nr:dockerin type I repeat-containing protein [Muribaculaceae bacterium]